MKKKSILAIILTLACLLPVLAGGAQALDDPAPQASCALLVDATHDEILYEKNAREKAYPASTTKVMTALLVVEAVESGQLTLEQPITVSETAMEGLASDGSTQGIKPGEVMSVQDLLYCMTITSANEAANILAEAVAGSVEQFVELMNQRAAQLGCQGTHFANPHGLHNEDHYTTAYDLYLIFREGLQHDLYLSALGTSKYTTQATNLAEPRVLYNTNALLSGWWYGGYIYDKAIAGKTGTTDEAGKCLVSAAEDGDTQLISVLMDAQLVPMEDGELKQGQFYETTRMFRWGFQNFERVTISKGDTPVAKVGVTLSEETEEVLVRPEGSLTLTLPVDTDLDAVEEKISLFAQTVEAPVEAGQVMGTMTLTYEDEVLGVLDLVAVDSVARSELLYKKAQIQSFFQNSGVKVLLGVVLLLAAVVALRLLVFRKSRRYAVRGGYSRRGRYSGRRRR